MAATFKSLRDVPAPVLHRMVTQRLQLENNSGSMMTSRVNLMGNRLDIDPKRDIDTECGYPTTITLEMYLNMWQRSGFARRVVSLYPTETWSVVPRVRQNNAEDGQKTDWDEKWDQFVFETNPFHYMYRGDLVCGLGQYGGIFFGLNDGAALDIPAPGIDPLTGEHDEKRMMRDRPCKVMFMRALSQVELNIIELENDPSSPRYQQPKFYLMDVGAPDNLSTMLSTPGVSSLNDAKTVKVHWSRILHIADNRFTSEVFGIPRMQQVYNRLLDLRKILGGSGEMFWKGAFPGYSFETQEGYGGDMLNEPDLSSIKDEFEDYYNNLKRYIATTGFNVKQLAPQVADPKSHVDQNLLEIATALEVPLRKLLGAEVGHLASTQDEGTWNKRIAKRQLDNTTPHIIMPFVRRIMAFGVLPTIPRFHTLWSDLNAMSEETKADVGLKKAQTLLQFVTSGAETVMPVADFLTLLLGFSAEAAQRMTSGTSREFLTRELWESPKAPAAGSGKEDSTQKTGVQNNGQG